MGINLNIIRKQSHNFTLLVLITFCTQLAYAGGTETPNNTFLGTGAGASVTTGFGNTLLGIFAGNAITNEDANTIIGHAAGQISTSEKNTFVGHKAGENNTTGSINTFIGERAGWSNTTGSYNVYIGERTGGVNPMGRDNTYIGARAGGSNSGSLNVFLGREAGYYENGSNKLHIANSAFASPLIYGEFDNDIVGISGSLGVGTQMPAATLHVSRADGTAKVLVEETNATVSPRTLFELANKGNTKFAINNTDAGVAWAFTNSGIDFRISRQGSGFVEFTVDNSGNMEVIGTSTATNHINSSSRALKHDFQDINESDILQRVSRLPISSWEYNKPDSGGRHIGPVAEDFRTVFGLGDGHHISTIDTSGIALAAIQGLNKKLEKRDVQIEERDAQIEQLKNDHAMKISDLQSMLVALSVRLEQLETAREE